MIPYLVPDWPAPRQVRCLQTLRAGGVSAPPYGSLNLGDHVGDAPASVLENRRRVSTSLPGEPLWLQQVHGVQVVNAAEVAVGVTADASYSRTQGTVCAVMTADCLPVLFCDEAGTVVGAAHAGWRGLAAGVLEATVAAMRAPASSLLAWLGPAIGPQAFEVGDEVRAAFWAWSAETAPAFVPGEPGKWFADIYALARLRLQRIGLQRIYGGGLCTASDADLFFSYRREGVTGRMASLIWLDAL